MRKLFHVTYEIVTEESAAEGDAAERGYMLPGEWKTPLDEVEKGAGDHAMTLREAIGLIGCVEDSGRWFSEVDDRPDYSTGASERRALHPPRNVSAASYARLARLLKNERLLI